MSQERPDLELVVEEPDARDQLIAWARNKSVVAYRTDFGRLVSGKRGPNRNGGLLLSEIFWLTHLARGRRDVVTVAGMRWVCRTRDEWMADVGMGARTVERMLALLADRDLIVRILRVSPLREHRGAAVNHVRPNSPRVMAGLAGLESLKRDQSPGQRDGGSSPLRTEAGPLFLARPLPETVSPPSANLVGVEPQNADSLTSDRESKRINIREESRRGATSLVPVCDDDPLIEALVSEGMGRPEALRLIGNRGPDICRRQLAAWRLVWQPQGKQIGYLVRAICEDWPEPPQLADLREREERAGQEQAAADQRRREAESALSRRDAAMAELQRIWCAMSEEQRAALDLEARELLPRWLRDRTSTPTRKALEQERWRLLAARRDIDLPEDV